MTHRSLIAALTVAAAAASMPAAAQSMQFRKTDDAIKYRQSVMYLQGAHVGRIFAMANGRVPYDAKTVADDAEMLASVNRYAFVGFIDGSEGGKTNAKPDVWTQRAKFDAAAKKATDEVGKLAAVAKGGTQDQVKAAVGSVTQACKACHDDFQKQ